MSSSASSVSSVSSASSVSESITVSITVSLISSVSSAKVLKPAADVRIVSAVRTEITYFCFQCPRCDSNFTYSSEKNLKEEKKFFKVFFSLLR